MRKTLPIIVAAVFSAACTGTTVPPDSSGSTDSSVAFSSEPTSSSSAMSSSSLAMSSASSSAVVLPSSSSAMSSSSAEANACNALIEEGARNYTGGASLQCTTCHGSPSGTTTDGNNPINIIDAPYEHEKDGHSEAELDVFIAKYMKDFLLGVNSVEQESEAVAAYLYDAAGWDWCADSTTSSVAQSSSSAPAGGDPKVVYAINVGGAAAATYQGVTYEPAGPLSPTLTGTENGTAVIAGNIAGTDEDALFQSQRYGKFTFELPVTTGEYNVTLFMAEDFAAERAIRIMSATAEGKVVFDNLDLFDTHGRLQAVTYSINDVAVSDGSLTLDFTAIANLATLGGILVTSVNGDKGEIVVPPSACDGTDNYVCLDFESGVFPPGYVAGTQVSIVNNDGARGSSKAMRFETQITSGYHQGIIRKDNVPGTHWGRMYYKTTPDLSGGFMHTAYAMFTAGDWEARIVDTVQQGGGAMAYLFNVQRNTDSECGAGNYEQCEYGIESGYTFQSSNDWICMEWHMDTSTQQYEVFRDGNRINGASGHMQNDTSDRANAKVVPDTLNWLGFGAQTFRPALQTGLVDEIIVGPARIGCD